MRLKQISWLIGPAAPTLLVGLAVLAAEMPPAGETPAGVVPASGPASEPANGAGPIIESAVDEDHPLSGPRSFDLRPNELYAAIESEYETRRVTTRARRGRFESFHKNRDTRLREMIGLRLDGELFDPNLLEYRALLELGADQNWYREQWDGRTGSDSEAGFLHEYDVSLEVLKSKPLSFQAYARRSDERIARRFLPSLRELRTEAGASGLLVLGDTTTRFGFDWRDVQRSGNRLDEDDEEYELTRFFLDHTWNIAEGHRLRVQYDRDREDSNYQGSRYRFDTHRDEIRLDHELAFGSAKQHRLDTYFRFNTEEGDLARDEIELVPRLTLRHSDRFETVYRYGYYQFDQQNLKVDQHKLDLQALWRPTDQWRISLDSFGLYESEYMNTDTYEFGGGFDVAWQRPTSWGELRVNVAAGFLHSRSSGDAGKRLVRGEAHPLGGSRPVFLRERDIIPGSIVAYDAARSRLYVPGVDYVAIPIGRRVRVRRLLTGRITEREVVYFDYQYRVPADGSITSYRGDFLVEHAFNFGLTPYYGYEGRCEEVSASRGFDRPRDNTHRHRIGARYGREQGEVGTEFEIYDDTWEPYDAWHLTGRVNLWSTATHNLDFSAELSRYWFEGGLDDRRVWWFDADLKDRARLTEALSALAGLGYRWEEDTSDGDTHGLDLEAGFQWIRGALSVELTVEYDMLSLVGNRDQTFGIYLTVRRDLTHLLPSPKAMEQ